jgi:hypothetical protein
MRSVVAAFLIVTLTCPAVAGEPVQAQPAAPTGAPLRAQLTDEAIRQAVKQTLADEQKESAIAPGRTLSGDARYQQFGRAVSEAKTPDCLHGDALKYQPTFFFAGLLAIPFWALAAIRGKCR